ncbi:MAG: ribokinase [Clostridia bacterium]
MNNICVVGSLNVDLTITVPRFHLPGETMSGLDFCTYTGGKGGNQAVAAARLGAHVAMLGCVGQDGNGQMYLDALKREGIKCAGVKVCEGQPTGVALIEVDPAGENRIVIVAGANAELTSDVVTEKAADIRTCDVCMFQLESPLVSINHAMALARQAGAQVMLDPAPAQKLGEAIYLLCDYLTPNETELALLTDMPVGTIDEAVLAAQALIARGVKHVVNKRGAQGALLVTKDGYKCYPGFKVEVKDTTAAGDSFNAGLAVGLARGYAIGEAIVLANAVGALSTMAEGAQGAMPTMADAEALIASSME